MGKSRLSLHQQLLDVIKPFYEEEVWEDLLEKKELPCYFEPPTGMQLSYPCIIYHWEGNQDDKANNKRYRKFRRYSLVVIDYDPDSEIPDLLIDSFSYCSMDRKFTAENLNHFSLTLYY